MAGTTQTLEQVIGRMVGKPFAWQGRGPDYYDCWGVVYEILCFLGCTEVPDYEDVNNPNSVIKMMAIETTTPKWQLVNDSRTGDVILLSKAKEIFHHAGVITEWGVVHAIPKAGVIVSKLQDLHQIGYKHQKVYRWAGSE